MATPKQLAALKKARAARKKNIAAKKTGTAKKPVKKIAVTAKSRATKKAPSARLKARRAKNLAETKGFYPNPDAGYIIKVSKGKTSGYFVDKKSRDVSDKFDTDIDKAYVFAGQFGKEYSGQMRDALATWARAANVKVSFSVIKKPKGAGFKLNPVPESSRVKMNNAADLFERFTGHEAGHYEKVPVNWPDVGLKVGKCEGILYQTIRDGNLEHYVHRFKKSARPDFTVSHDGRQIALVGGKFAFTERGIVDT